VTPSQTVLSQLLLWSTTRVPTEHPHTSCWASFYSGVRPAHQCACCLPACVHACGRCWGAVWGDLVTKAADPQDIDQASSRILRGLLALSQALGASDLQLVNTQGLEPLQLDSYNLAALRRIQQRATTTGRELVPLLLTGSIKDWEELIADSFQHGTSLHLEESTMKQQVCPLAAFILLLKPQWLPLDTCRPQHRSCLSACVKGPRCLHCLFRWTITYVLLGQDGAVAQEPTAFCCYTCLLSACSWCRSSSCCSSWGAGWSSLPSQVQLCVLT
jgi:hypothetical protein